MSRTRKRDPRDVPASNEYNPLYAAFQEQFEQVFADLHADIPYGTECTWYVDRRWDDIRRCFTDPLEERFFRLLHQPVVSGQKRTILVWGGTGHGKSTFVQHFFRSYLPRIHPEEAKKIYYLRIHISSNRSAGDMEEDVDHQVSDTLTRYFPWLEDRDHYLKVWETVYNFDSHFYEDLMQDYPTDSTDSIKRGWIEERKTAPGRLSETKWADYNRARINYLIHTMGFHFVLCFDNVDQADLSVQLEAFRLARHKLEWISDTPHCTIIVVVRDYMVERSRTELPQQAYRTKEFRIWPPDIDQILESRLALFSAAGKDAASAGKSVVAFKEDISVSLNDGLGLMRHMIRCFTKSKATRTFLYEVSNNNARRQLDMVHEAMRSPGLKAQEVLEYIRTFTEQTPKMVVEPDEIVRLLLSPGPRFGPSPLSPVINVFDLGDDVNPMNTLVIYTILALFEANAYWYHDELHRELLKSGAYPALIDKAIQFMLDCRLLYSEQGTSLRDDRIRLIERTTAGKAYLHKITFRLFYCEVMGFVTPLDQRFVGLLPDKTLRILDKVRGAAALYHQLREDEEWRRDQLRRNLVPGWMGRYKMKPSCELLRERVLAEVTRIRELKTDQNTIRSWFESPDSIS